MSVLQRAARTMRRLWTKDEYYRMLELGFFLGQRVELIEGVVIEKPAQKNFHAIGITLVNEALKTAFGPGFWVRVQNSMDLSPLSVPDPDLAVVVGNPRDYRELDNPATALLVVEVSDTTLRLDRKIKGSLYARAGIAEYWILNLVKQQLEVRRQPVADESQRFGARYESLTILVAGDNVTPLAAPAARIEVADMLP